MLSRKTFNFKLSTFNFRGFTLLELLVVMAIMALLTAMSAPAISGYLRGARLRGGARQVASALRQARQLAITERAQRAVILYHIDNAVSIYENDSVVSRPLPGTIDLADGGGNKIAPDGRVTFTARGTASNKTIRVYDTLDNFREITVVNATGRVRIGDVNEDL